MLITALIVFNCRSTLRKEKKKRRKSYLLYPKNTAHLRKKEGQPMKAVEMNPKVENKIGTQVMALKTVRGNNVNLPLVKMSYI